VNPNGLADGRSGTSEDGIHGGYATSNTASASTADIEIKAGESITLEPWTSRRIEATGSVGVLNEGDLRVIVLIADED